jgi:hypothetical protein
MTLNPLYQVDARFRADWMGLRDWLERRQNRCPPRRLEAGGFRGEGIVDGHFVSVDSLFSESITGCTANLTLSYLGKPQNGHSSWLLAFLIVAPPNRALE